MTWLSAVPVAVVSAYSEMLDRLKAEEEMAAATCGAVGRALKIGPWVKKQLSQWTRTIRGRERATRVTAPDLKSMGIGGRQGKRRR